MTPLVGGDFLVFVCFVVVKTLKNFWYLLKEGGGGKEGLWPSKWDTGQKRQHPKQLLAWRAKALLKKALEKKSCLGNCSVDE